MADPPSTSLRRRRAGPTTAGVPRPAAIWPNTGADGSPPGSPRSASGVDRPCWSPGRCSKSAWPMAAAWILDDLAAGTQARRCGLPGAVGTAGVVWGGTAASRGLRRDGRGEDRRRRERRHRVGSTSRRKRDRRSGRVAAQMVLDEFFRLDHERTWRWSSAPRRPAHRGGRGVDLARQADMATSNSSMAASLATDVRAGARDWATPTP